jgi:hypothetical protein
MNVTLDITTVISMLTMVQSAILHVADSVTLPEPTALILMGTLMLTIGNLQRRATLLAKQALRGSSNL